MIRDLGNVYSTSYGFDSIAGNLEVVHRETSEGKLNGDWQSGYLTWSNILSPDLGKVYFKAPINWYEILEYWINSIPSTFVNSKKRKQNLEILFV